MVTESSEAGDGDQRKGVGKRNGWPETGLERWGDQKGN